MAGPGMEVGAIYATIEARGFAQFAQDVQRIGQGIDRAKGQIQGFITETYRVQKTSGASIAGAFAKQFAGAGLGSAPGATGAQAAGPAKKSSIGVTSEVAGIIAEMAKIRKPFTQLQRALNQIGGEMTEGLQVTSQLMRRVIAKQMEPQMKQLQKSMIDQIAAAKGWGPVMKTAFSWGVGAATNLGKFNYQLAIIQKGLAPITDLATKGFYALTGGILGFVTAGLAGTVQGAAFSYQFQQLSRQIAAVFLPIIDQVFEKLQELVEWFRNLSDEQLNQIEHWALVAAEVLGAGFVFGKLIGYIGGVTKALQAMILAAIELGIEFNAATGGILLLIGALATGFGVWAVKTEEGHGALRKLWDALQPIWEALKRLGDEILAAAVEGFTALGEVLGDLNVGDFFVDLIDSLTWVINLLRDAIVDAQMLWDIAKGAVGIVASGLEAVGIGGGSNAGAAAAGNADRGELGAGFGGSFGGPNKGHRELTQQGTGFESLVSSFSRIQTAALKVDYQRKASEGIDELVGIVGDIKDNMDDGGGGSFGGGVELGN